MIYTWPHPILSTPCRPVKLSEADEITELLVREAEAAANCAGLSAPQIGKALRAFVIKRNAMEPLVLLNPQGVFQGAWEDGRESCLSLPGVVVAVKRPTEVVIRYQEVRGGQWHEMNAAFRGFEARVACHEMDHLEGKTLLDYMSRAQRGNAIGIMQTARMKASRRPVLKNPASSYFNGD